MAASVLLAVTGKPTGLSPEVAGYILWSITGVGAIAWLLALRGYIKASALGGGGAESSWAKVVAGSAADVADGLARALASPSWGSMPLLVKREGDNLLVAVPAGRPRLRSVPCFSRCAVELRPVGESQTEVIFRMDFAVARARALRTAGVLLGAGLALLIGLPLFLHFFVVSAEDPKVRFQVIQAIHFGHLLWPPWLCYALYKRSRRATEMFLTAAAANASVLAEAFAARRARDSGGE